MMQFWMISALLMGLAALFIVWPLWRGSVKNNEIERNAANLEILRDQIAEMDADVRNGLLSPELYEQGKRELQMRALEEISEEQASKSAAGRKQLWMLALALVVLMPLAAIGLYWKIGNHQALQAGGTAAQGMSGVLRSDASIKKLEEKLASQPEDPEGWWILARSYGEQNRFADAVRAYDKLTRLVPDDAQLWADYADMLAMSQEQSLAGRPTELLNRALQLDPNNAKALALSGTAAMEQGHYEMAANYWEKLLKMIPPDSEDARMVAAGVQMAKSFQQMRKSGVPKAEAKQKPKQSGSERISGAVSLSAALKNRVSPDDTVFILARAAQGPKMPLAILRKQVRDLPVKFALDDSMAMSPQMRLSGFDSVIVVARVSKSGNAMPEPGDFQGVSKELKPGSTGIDLIIDSEIK